jgi:hypothetical protein
MSLSPSGTKLPKIRTPLHAKLVEIRYEDNYSAKREREKKNNSVQKLVDESFRMKSNRNSSGKDKLFGESWGKGINLSVNKKKTVDRILQEIYLKKSFEKREDSSLLVNYFYEAKGKKKVASSGEFVKKGLNGYNFSKLDKKRREVKYKGMNYISTSLVYDKQ